MDGRLAHRPASSSWRSHRTIEALQGDHLLKVRVHDLVDGPALAAALGPGGQADLASSGLSVHGGSRTQHLEQHHPKYTSDLSDPAAGACSTPGQGTRKVPFTTVLTCVLDTLVGPTLRARSRTTATPLLIEQDIGGLHVAVYDGVLGTGVEVVQPGRSAGADLEPLLPGEWGLSVL
ncbi:hypothetical protein NL676_005275 [Syzygium grande]|nr:hypothetical protein NL676_005275 [Syzygium grande]